MSDVADRDLCVELYELSGWNDNSLAIHPEWQDFSNICPAYSLGYLLRKLPKKIEREDDGNYTLNLHQWQKDGVWYWEINYGRHDSTLFLTGKNAGYVSAKADTPENAAAQLCIQLIKSGIIPIKENLG